MFCVERVAMGFMHIGEIGRWVANRCGLLVVTPEKVLEIQQYAREPISLDQTIGDEGDSQLGDFIEDADAVVGAAALAVAARRAAMAGAS